jgi:hypothetical protein
VKIITFKYVLRQALMIETGDEPDEFSSDAQQRVDHSQTAFVALAKEKGIASNQIGGILKKAGFNGYDEVNWEQMVAALEQTVA